MGGGNVTGVRPEFVADLFSSPSVFDEFVDEFEATPLLPRREKAKRDVQRRVGTGLGALSPEGARALHALVRATEPEVVIETGVLNGFSSSTILYAMEKNETGKLHSIDYPVHAGETFRETTNARIPEGRDPGWLVPEDLDHRWELTLGKSQRKLPEVITQYESVDLFVQDSEHTAPCMMFEYEVAWEWLGTGGVILTDDINYNDAFDTFVEVREPPCYGYATDGIGYIRK